MNTDFNAKSSMMATEDAVADGGLGTTISYGKIEITANISVTYEFNGFRTRLKLNFGRQKALSVLTERAFLCADADFRSIGTLPLFRPQSYP